MLRYLLNSQKTKAQTTKLPQPQTGRGMIHRGPAASHGPMMISRRHRPVRDQKARQTGRDIRRPHRRRMRFNPVFQRRPCRLVRRPVNPFFPETFRPEPGEPSMALPADPSSIPARLAGRRRSMKHRMILKCMT
jgi:hypothetical protein